MARPIEQLDECTIDLCTEDGEPSMAYAIEALQPIEIVSGRDAVLARAGLLEELGGRCGQPGAMHGLDYLLHHPYTARKTPHLICFFSKDGGRDLCGAVLLFEYRLGPWKTGLFSTGDSFGVRTVLGPEHLRSAIASRTCSAMLQAQARMVLVTYRQEPVARGFLTEPDAAGTSFLWATRTRQVQDRLPLARTADATLAQFGKRTRTHLRYYRRRLEEAVPCDFLPDVTAWIDPADTALLKQLNRNSRDPIAQETFNLQYRTAAASPSGFVSGLRSKQGQWLALVGGWRQNGTTWVQWQANARGFEPLSIGTALRSFLIEQEVHCGTLWLAFHGGTSHSMQHAFLSERVVDLLARRRGIIQDLLVRLLPTLHRLLPALSSRGNFLADALGNASLRWSSNMPASGRSS